MTSATRVCAIALLAAAVAFPAAAQTELTERFSKVVHLDQNGTFDLTNINGNIVNSTVGLNSTDGGKIWTCFTSTLTLPLASKYVPSSPTFPKISTLSLTWSGVCALPGMFSEAPEAVRLNTRPE